MLCYKGLYCDDIDKACATGVTPSLKNRLSLILSHHVNWGQLNLHSEGHGELLDFLHSTIFTGHHSQLRDSRVHAYFI